MLKKQFIGRATVQQEVRGWLQLSLGHLPKDQQFSIQLAVTEVVQNIYRYAYGHQDGGDIIIEVHAESGQELTITARDFGVPCQPELFLHKTHAASERGGMGLTLINKNAAAFTITPLADGNLAQLVFHLSL
ncbi:MAG: ATP-binding protein [Burkholderiales bacterium]|jgi:anti-sigma regulatory factor (Ser/Thr protein kinase)|nr:ATP-binding protein [Burkholderiales bacterium]